MDTDTVLLAHIQSRIGTLNRKDAEFGLNAFDQARLEELNLMLNILSAANRLRQLAVGEPEKEAK